jgi:hypothetical protein
VLSPGLLHFSGFAAAQHTQNARGGVDLAVQVSRISPLWIFPIWA